MIVRLTLLSVVDSLFKPLSLLDSDDIMNVDLTKVHNLSGPVSIEGAEPGDVLVVDILDGIQLYRPIGRPLSIVISHTFRADALGLHCEFQLFLKIFKCKYYHPPRAYLS